jgi:hypothetical protein
MAAESLSRQDKRGLILVALPGLVGGVADLMLWRLAGPVTGAPRTYLGFISWPQTVPAAARELIDLGSRPFSTLAEAVGWHWRDSGFDWLAWLGCIFFWFALAAVLTRVEARLLRFCVRIGITRLLGAAILSVSPWGLVTLPLLHLQWILLALSTLLAVAMAQLRRRRNLRTG